MVTSVTITNGIKTCIIFNLIPFTFFQTDFFLNSCDYICLQEPATKDE